MKYSGRPIAYPKAYYSSFGELSMTLEVTTCTYNGPNTSFVTRCYNGMLPGPTLYVYPGDKLTIKLVNKLSDERHTYFHNFWQKLNVTYNGKAYFQDQVGKPCHTVEPGALKTGTLVEWKAMGIQNHPFHFHVNPYQVADADYSHVGDEADFAKATG